MEFLKKVQSLPERQRKIILWLTMTFIVLICLWFWLNLAQKRIKKIDENPFGEIETPDLNKENLLPSKEIGEMKEKWVELQELEELMQKTELSDEDLKRLKELIGEEFSLEDLRELKGTVNNQEVD